MTRGAAPGLERLAPARGAQAPAIAGLEPGKIEIGLRRREVVAARLGEGEELRRHLDADRVQPDILGSGVTAAGAEEAGQRPLRAALERLAIDVLLARRGDSAAAPAWRRYCLMPAAERGSLSGPGCDPAAACRRRPPLRSCRSWRRQRLELLGVSIGRRRSGILALPSP